MSREMQGLLISLAEQIVDHLAEGFLFGLGFWLAHKII